MTLNNSTLLLLLFSAIALVSGARDRYAAFPAAPNGLMPRYFVDGSVPLLVERDGHCPSGQHPCDDINHSKFCCSNDHYCFITKDGDAGCCAIGSDCSLNSKCKSDHFQCTTTHTLTASGSGTRSQSSQTSRASTSLEVNCCPRRCPVSSLYQCPSSLGGACCAYGLNCAEDGKCVGVVTAPTGTFTGVLTPEASGCTTSQFRCSDGMGCCDVTQSCTDISGTGYCVAAAPTQSGVQVEQDGGGGLSSGAKAGIAVGVIVGSGLIILAGAYLFITKRKQKRQRVERPGVGAQPGQDGTGTGNTGDDGSHTYPGGYDPTMSEITASSRPRVVGPGLTQDYFGPDAVVGPFTQATTRPGASQTLDRAVNLTPQGPGDIAAPVEIGSEGTKSPVSNILSPASPLSRYETPPTNTVEGMFELYGSHPAETEEVSTAASQTSQAPVSLDSEDAEGAEHGGRDERSDPGSGGVHGLHN